MSQYYVINPSSELYHHGILGQKWGVRRYQNEDGTLTDAGKRRLDKYKERENKALDKKYGKELKRADQRIDTAKKRLNKLLDKDSQNSQESNNDGKSTPYTTNDPKKARALTNYVYAHGAKDQIRERERVERNAVANATLADVKSERSATARAVGASIVTALGAAAVVTLTPAPVAFFYAPNLSNIKEANRRKRTGADE